LKLDVAFMIDQSHNLKGKMEAMVQTVMSAQELWLKAALSIHSALCGTGDMWRKSRASGAAGNPLAAAMRDWPFRAVR
jgi:L-rhamnose isomerase